MKFTRRHFTLAAIAALATPLPFALFRRKPVAQEVVWVEEPGAVARVIERGKLCDLWRHHG